jgi:RNA polymerase sigma-70 factor (ECF subfamily)
MDIPEAGAIRTLYDGHAAALRGYVRRLTADPARAEDVVQQALLRASQHPELVDGSPRAWLFTLARNMIIDEASRERDRMLMADAMAQLSPAHRAVVHRSYYRGLTIAQIAGELGIAEDTVKSRLHHALRALRQSLQEGVAQ